MSCNIFRDTRKVVVKNSVGDLLEELSFDKLLICAGPWTNQILGPDVMYPPLSPLALIVSNEQTQDFDDK